MATEAQRPGTIADGGGGDGWSNLANAVTSDDSRANTTGTAPSTATGELLLTNCGFSIPAGATINGVSVAVEGHWQDQGAGGGPMISTDSGLIISGVWNNGSGVSPAAELTENTDTTDTWGSATETWGGLPTVAQANASNFGVGLQWVEVGAADVAGVYIDDVVITIHYTPAAGGGNKHLPIKGCG